MKREDQKKSEDKRVRKKREEAKDRKYEANQDKKEGRIFKVKIRHDHKKERTKPYEKERCSKADKHQRLNKKENSEKGENEEPSA